MDKLKQKKKGFTLIELLATIAILAIVSLIVIFTATNVIKKSRENSYLASISNIEKESSSYAIENNRDIKWISTDDNLGEYYCVAVKDLIDIGFFDRDVLESEIDKDVFVQEDDYIYLERDYKSKTITKNILLAGKNSDKKSLCDDFRTDGIISFSTVVGWSNNKDVTIDYHILNYKGVASDYEYYYMREDTGEEVREVFNNSPDMSVKVKEFKAEEINARIYYQNIKIAERTFKTKVDHIKPRLELLVNNGNVYTKNKEVYISLIDNESGFKRGKHRVYYKWSLKDLTCEEIISNGEYIDISIDANNINKSNQELMYLNNYSGNGKIYVCSDTVYDYVGNKLDDVYSTDVYLDNDKPIINLGNYEKNDKAREIVRIELLVSDNTSGIKDGSFTKEDLIVKVGDTVIDISNLTLTKKEEGKYELVINNKTEHGKVVITVKEDSVEDFAGNKNEEYKFTPEITFRNAYKINYNANGGTGSMTVTECLYGESCTLRENSFTRLGHTFLGWSESSSATSATYDDRHTFSNYSETSDMTLYAVWVANKYNINYNANGGRGSMTATSCTYGSSCTLMSNSFSRTGHEFIGWNTKSDGSGTSYIDEYLFESYLKTENITLYAQWKILDKTPPICILSVDGTTITASPSDSGGSGILYKGWDSSYSGTNSTTTKISSAKKYTYYVKDNAGNTGSCSISIANIETIRSEYCATGGSWPNCQSCTDKQTCTFTCFNNSGGSTANSSGHMNSTNTNPCQGYSKADCVWEKICTSVAPSVSIHSSCPSGYLEIKNNSSYCYK